MCFWKYSLQIRLCHGVLLFLWIWKYKAEIINWVILNLNELIIVREENIKKIPCFLLACLKSRRNMGNKIFYMMYSIYMYIPTFGTCFNSLRALRTELFRDEFHIADSSSFFFKGCKIIGTITKVPLYSIKVTGVVLGPYQLWRRMFGSEAVVFQPDGGWRSSYFNSLLTWNGGPSRTFLREKYTHCPQAIVSCWFPKWPGELTSVIC